MAAKKSVKKPAKKPVKATKKPTRKSPRKTTRKSPDPLAGLGAALGNVCLRGKPIPEPVWGVGSVKPGTYFDQPCQPSAFAGISPVEPDLVPCKTKQGLDKAKQIIEFCECPISLFDNWRARLSTDQGTYELIGPKRITREVARGSKAESTWTCSSAGWK